MLTQRTVRDAKPGQKAIILWDKTLAGFGCKVFPGGRKSYVLSYRIGGRKRLATLARCSEISLRAAREKAGAELVRIRDGETDPLERRRLARDAPTVADALNRFFDETAPARIQAGRMTGRTVREYTNQAARYVRPSLGSLQVAKVTRRDIEKLAATMAETPAQRNRVLAFVSRIFTLAEHWEWRDQRTNPVRGVERAREEARDRVLEPSELARLNAALGSLEGGHPYPVAAIRTAAMTGLRISECPVAGVGERLVRDQARGPAEDEDGPAHGSARGPGARTIDAASARQRRPVGVRGASRRSRWLQDGARRVRPGTQGGRPYRRPAPRLAALARNEPRGVGHQRLHAQGRARARYARDEQQVRPVGERRAHGGKRTSRGHGRRRDGGQGRRGRADGASRWIV